MKTKPINLAIAALALLFAVILVAIQWREYWLIRQAHLIQARLESYHHQHGQYPDSLSRMGLSERLEGPIYYQRESDSSYRLWFGTQLGESKTFRSTTQT